MQQKGFWFLFSLYSNQLRPKLICLVVQFPHNKKLSTSYTVPYSWVSSALWKRRYMCIAWLLYLHTWNSWTSLWISVNTHPY